MSGKEVTPQRIKAKQTDVRERGDSAKDKGKGERMKEQIHLLSLLL